MNKRANSKKMTSPLLSLCLPTNGIIEWVFPVLDSIYAQNVDNSLFEVVVTDNGDNVEFYNLMTEYACKHGNLKYKKTNAYMFDNQLEALKLAEGEYFKFVNHRAVFTENSLQYLIDAISANLADKPVIYFSCGALKEEKYILDDFNDFVRTLRRYASWTTGVGIWKEDYKRIPSDKKFDKISPHSGILFSERKKDKYIIDNFVFSKEIETNHSKKGTYDLFKAFAVEEVMITLNLFIDGDITAETFRYVKNDYKQFVCRCYWDFCVKHNPCSYNLKGFDDSMGIFFKKPQIFFGVFHICCISAIRKTKRVFFRR